MSEVKVNKISPRTNCGTVTVGDAGDSVTVTAGVPVTVNGDLKSNALKAVDGGSIISQCGTTITLGASGDTINLAAGASQTGFGRTGTVDWDTTAKTASFTAVSGNGYFVNTTSGAVTVTLPASPSAGDIVAVADYASTANTNNITVGRNSSNINGSASDIIISIDGKSITLVYVDGTQGWKITDNADQTTEIPAFITATGGTITCCGDYKIHTFTGPGTFTVTCAGNPAGSNSVDYLVVAGGGGNGDTQGSGGGGAGGFRESKAPTAPWGASPLATCVSLPVTASPYPVTVGAGGSSTTYPTATGNPGSNSVFSTITSTGGGGAGRGSDGAPGAPGGSGGGGGGRSGQSGGTGNTPPVSPPQGQPGGLASPAPGPSCSDTGGGGGGAIVAGGNGSPNGPGGDGGDGATTSISGSPTSYAGGGGGGSQIGSGGAGGLGGGGAGNSGGGTINTGGGAGGNSTSGAYSGGSGIVIIRYKYQ